jgi:hypothetical protein
MPPRSANKRNAGKVGGRGANASSSGVPLAEDERPLVTLGAFVPVTSRDKMAEFFNRGRGGDDPEVGALAAGSTAGHGYITTPDVAPGASPTSPPATQPRPEECAESLPSTP